MYVQKVTFVKGFYILKQRGGGVKGSKGGERRVFKATYFWAINLFLFMCISFIVKYATDFRTFRIDAEFFCVKLRMLGIKA